MRCFSFIYLLSAWLWLPGTTMAQPGEAAPGPLLAEHKTTLINDLSEMLMDVYVFEDVAGQMVELIQQNHEKGEYDRFESLSELTARLTADLQSISHDKHLHVEAAAAPQRDSAGEQLSEEELSAQRLAAARARNFGFKRLEMLPGNIGYLDLRSFSPAEMAGPTAVAAMNFLANSSAIIFDLRRNSGGSPSMIQLLSSYLFEESEHLNSFYVRRTDSTEQFWTQASVQGPRMSDTPVYVLTSSRTFSAAEEFTYNLKNMQRATIVGETTGGGAHPVDFAIVELGGGHYASVSLPYGRAINPITGTNWEGTGVSPQIEAPADQALDIAQLQILKQLAESSPDGIQKFNIEWARDELEFRLEQPQYNMDGAGAYVGNYGPRKIFIREGKLYYQRGDGQPFELQAMKTADQFHVGELDYFRIRFERDTNGQVSKLTGLYDNGHVDGNLRDRD